MLRVACLSLAALLLGCASTTKYHLSPMAPEWKAGYWCVDACDKDRSNNDYFDCLEKCPAVTTAEGECNDFEKPPHGFCEEKHEEGFGDYVGEAIGGLIGLAFAVGTIAAAF